MDLLDQSPLGADPLQVADQEHADQLGVDRGPADGAVVLGHTLAQETEIQQRIYLAQRMPGWGMILQAEDVEQRLPSCLPSHHPCCLPPTVQQHRITPRRLVQPPRFSPESAVYRKEKAPVPITNIPDIQATCAVRYAT
jgi:hypothetical protein